jgi:all-trans-retinol 13,14-reductase
MEEGQTLERFFRYLGITGKVPLKKLDESGFDRITVGGEEETYCHAMGWENFRDSLVRQFPRERDAISTYVSTIREAIRGIPLYDLENAFTLDLTPDQLNRCTAKFLDSLTPDSRLKTALLGANSMYHGAALRTPLYLHACIRNSFVSSAYRIAGGSDQLTDALVDAFRAAGGTLATDAEVTGFEFEGDIVSGVVLKDGRKFFSKKFISNLHPATTLKLLPEDKVRKVYRHRIENLENSAGFFTLYLVFRPGFFQYQDFNHFHYYSDEYFKDALPESEWPQTYMVYTPFNDNQGRFTRTASVLSFMNYEDYRKWDGMPPAERGKDYDEFRERSAERLLDAVERRYPGIRGGIEKYFVSTPLTFTDFTGTPQGSGYGILKDCEHPARSIILPKTKIPNLYFTGQNLNIHGVLGTTINAVVTCSELVGFRHLVKKIVHA